MKYLKQIAVVVSLIGISFAETDGLSYQGKSSALLDAICEKSSSISSIHNILDPTYDQTFKLIFTDRSPSHEVIGISSKKDPCEESKDILKSLLNSLLYPETYDNQCGFKIRELELIHTESPFLGSTSSLGLLRFDIACRCTCWEIDASKAVGTRAASSDKAEKKFVFDIEMQRGVGSGFELRLAEYNHALGRDSDVPARVLAFLNVLYKQKDGSSSVKNESFCIRSVKTRHVDDLAAKVSGTVIADTCVDAIDLRKCVDFLKAKQNIYVAGKPLGKAGREWLGLLGVIHWAGDSDKGNPVSLYGVPVDDEVTPEVKIAIDRLSCVNQSVLDAVTNDIKAERGVIEAAEKRGMEEERKKAVLGMKRYLDTSTIAEILKIGKDEVEKILKEAEESKGDHHDEDEKSTE